MPTPAQCRMARAALKVSAKDVADAIGVSHMTISRYENEQSDMSASTAASLTAYFQDREVAFSEFSVMFPVSKHTQERSDFEERLLGDIAELVTTKVAETIDSTLEDAFADPVDFINRAKEARNRRQHSGAD